MSVSVHQMQLCCDLLSRSPVPVHCRYVECRTLRCDFVGSRLKRDGVRLDPTELCDPAKTFPTVTPLTSVWTFLYLECNVVCDATNTRTR